MSELILSKPSINLKNEIVEYRKEFIEYEEGNINGTSGLIRYEDVDEWLEMIIGIEKEHLSNQNVNASTFFTIDTYRNKIIGSIQLRHSLTPALEFHGGHIGYGVRPTERGKGFGKSQLLLGLNQARAMKMTRVLLTCNKENEKSRRTIESCGGTLESESEYEGKIQLNYWINL